MADKHTMSREEIQDIVSACVRQVFEEERSSFWVAPERHYQHHQLLEQCSVDREKWKKNHEFVEEWRGTVGTGKKIGFVTAMTSISAFIIGAIWLAIKHAVQQP